MVPIRLSLTVALCCIAIGWSTAQIKYEKEEKTDVEQVPAAAVDFIHAVDSLLVGRWYREISNQGTSYEWKGKINDQCTSIEFDQDGSLQDVEILRKFAKLPLDLMEILQKSLSTRYQRYSVRRCQEQWAGTSVAIKNALIRSSPTDDLSVKYELVVRARHGHKDDTERYELLLKLDGSIVREAMLVRSLSDHMDY